MSSQFRSTGRLMMISSQILLFLIGFQITFGYAAKFHRNRLHLNAISNAYNTDVEVKKQESLWLLKKVALSNDSITCNDGSEAGYYLRKTHQSRKWIIFLEGGWYCYDDDSCKMRWSRLRHMMTSTNWPDSRDVGGILSPDITENPFFWNANHVFLPYCTSDFWSGSREKGDGLFSFMGHLMLEQAIKDLLPLGLESASEVLLTGSSAGGIGVLLNLDHVKNIINVEYGYKKILVRGVCDSGWFLDREPYNVKGAVSVDTLKTGMAQWKGIVPDDCDKRYGNDKWMCYLGYRIYPFIKTPLFIFQWLFDEVQMRIDNVGAPTTKKQWDFVHKMGKSVLDSFQNMTGVFAPSCVSHSILSRSEWTTLKVNDVTLPQAIHCWLKVTARQHRRACNSSKPARQQRHLKKSKSSDDNDPTDQSTRSHKRGRNGHKKRNRRLKNGRNNPNGRNETSVAIPRGKKQKRLASRNSHKKKKRCTFRLMDNCSWPQCNNSCPSLLNPYTGEEIDFVHLLQSFGFDMQKFADALGIDIHTLNNMNHSEILDMLNPKPATT